jgi:hypothetical protein
MDCIGNVDLIVTDEVNRAIDDRLSDLSVLAEHIDLLEHERNGETDKIQ